MGPQSRPSRLLAHPGKTCTSQGERFILNQAFSKFVCQYSLHFTIDSDRPIKIMEHFERFISEQKQFLSEFNYLQFITNLLVTAALAYFLGLFYVKYGNAVSNRRRFSRNFLPLGLTTMLIIFVVKSSVALSLGLVGALSIVRFRSAIKDPEELTYLFLTIGIGVAAGAGEIWIALLAFVVIILLLLGQAFLRKKKFFAPGDNMHLNLRTSHRDLSAITAILAETFPFVELKRIDDNGQQLDLSYVVEARSVEQINQARMRLMELSPNVDLSFVEQRNIAV
ncbi:MAG: hypothetical protein RLZZ165_1166 [Bacteroidota bacterium]|jgi:uncharacterized membrane protein YhiD involved in acid resistance